MVLQPRPVLGEVTADGPDQQGRAAEDTEPEADVGGRSTPLDRQRIHEEGQRHPIELVDDQLVGEAAGKVHQVVGRDRPGHGDGHNRAAYRAGTREAVAMTRFVTAAARRSVGSGV